MCKGSFFSLALLLQFGRTLAATVEYDWEVTWVNSSPDGFERPVIGINGQWPCPSIEANVGDTIEVKLTNSMDNQTTGLHFHGISQYNTNYMDGASMVNQCPVIPGSSITYRFLADKPGTFWYHSHNMGQYPDGLRGPLIIHDPEDPYFDEYDEEVVLSFSDWYHSQTIPLVQAMLAPNNTEWRPPNPDSLLVNEGGSRNILVQVGKTYRIRMINFSALASVMINFDSHTQNVIMTDSSYVQKQGVSLLRIAPSQRYDVLITVSRRDFRGITYLAAMDINRDYLVDPEWNKNVTGYLMSDSRQAPNGNIVLSSFTPYEEENFVPLDSEAALGPVTKVWELNFDYCRDANNYSRACFNGQPYIGQLTPTLYSAATLGDANADPEVYGPVSAFVVNYNDVVEVVVNNRDVAIHPFHLHGHHVQIIDRPAADVGDFNGTYSGGGLSYPPKRDVITINAQSYIVLRFVADNPGVFLFHCHVEWHVEMGLTATLIEAPEMLHDYPIPQDFIDSCEEQGIPVSGNAAGYSDDPTDTYGFITTPLTDYYGATWPYPGPPTTKRRKGRVVRKRNERWKEIW